MPMYSPRSRGPRSAVVARATQLIALVAVMLTPLLPVLAGTASAAASAVTTDDWTNFLHDVARTNASADTTLSTANAANLGKLWSFKTGGVIAASPTVVNGTVYVGSWDGNEYALDQQTGALKWKQSLGTTSAPACTPSNPGISSAAAVVNGVVYVGGGDSNWYALDATTGAILWSVPTGDNSATGGHYNWSSPLIYNGYAYIGIASLGDCPLVQGQLLKVDLSSGQIVATVNMVPTGQIGGGIWTTPALDTSTNTIYVTTGTEHSQTQQYAQAIVAIDANTLAIKDYWKLPEAVAVPDSDFGTSPILFNDINGNPLVGAINKNGMLYVFNRTNLAAGPIWQQRIALGGDCPQCGQGTVSSGAFANNTLFFAGGNTTINGVGYTGSVQAFDPASGNIRWQHGAPATIIASIAYDNGLIIDGAGPTLEVLDASTGTRLYSYGTTSWGVIYAAPSVSQGNIYFGSTDGYVYALGLTAPVVPPADPACPSGWVCQDIGSPTPAGSESVSGNVWTVSAGGAGINGISDSFRFGAQNVSGDTQITAQVGAPQSASATAQAGLMIRQSNDPGSPFYAEVLEPNNKLVVLYRTQFGGPIVTENTVTTGTPPLYLEVQRKGDTLTAATSTDGTNYTLVPGTTTQVPMSATILAGLAASSGTSGTASTATFTAPTAGAPSNTPAAPQSNATCPTGWSCADIGNPALLGSQSLSGGTWTLQGAGTDISGPRDQFHYVWQTVASDAVLSARVASQTNTSSWAKAGLMFRQSTDPASPFYSVSVTPGNGVAVQYRVAQGYNSSGAPAVASTVPVYLEVTRTGNTFSAYTSTDGQTWTAISGSTATLSTSGTMLVGLSVTSHSATALSTATMDSVSLTIPPPTSCPSGWTCGDVGNPTVAGSQSVSGSTWTISGSGNDIWATSDQFRYVYQAVTSGDSITAHITSQSNTNAWAKAGVMLRQSTSANDAFYAAFITPSNGIVVEYRTVLGAGASQPVAVSGTVPTYLAVAQNGSTFTTYTSADGVVWTAVPGSSVNVTMIGPILAGVAVTSHQDGSISVVSVDSVTINAGAPGACPTGWNCGDIGAPALAGTQSLDNGIWTVQGSGNDIWAAPDQFHYVYQSLAADGSVSVHITAQSNTNAWAKAGVMIRQSTNANDAYYGVFVTPGNGIVVQYRTSSGATAAMAVQTTGAVPTYLQIARTGNTFTAYTSSDGQAWTVIAGSTITLGTSGSMVAGLAVTSHNAAAISTITADSLTITSGVASTCPTNWNCGDIGSPITAGTQSLSNGTWTVQGAGNDIWATTDQFHYVWQPLSADGSVSAHVTAQSNTNAWAKAGVMFRQSTSASDAYYGVFVTPGNGITIQYRTSAGVGAQQAVVISGTVPTYLAVARVGNTFTAYTSSDGRNWSAVPGSTETLSTSGSMLAGLAVTSHNGGTLSTITADSLAISANALSICPTGWSCGDIGSPALSGTQTLSNGTWSVQGSGSDIAGTSDQFHYVYQTVAADGSVSAHVTAQSNTNAWAKAGVMFRQSTSAGDIYYAVEVTPANGIVVQYRRASGGYANQIVKITGTVPTYLEAVRAGNTFSAYTSTDGTTWTLISGSSINLATSGSMLAGLAVTSHNTSALSTVTADSLTISATVPSTCPTGWTCADVGTPTLAGTQSLANGTWTVQGAGGDIWGTSDQFHYVYQTLAGDGSASAHITSQTNTSAWAKAGVMLRQSTAAGDAYYGLFVTPSNGIVVQYRTASGASAQQAVQVKTGTVPTYLKVSRSGNSFSAYTSTDGTNWTLVPNSTVTITMNTSVLAGMAVTAHNGSASSSAVFDTVSA